MTEIKVETTVTPQRLAELGVAQWPVWSKEISRFAWHYDTAETCYFLQGQVIVTPDGGAPVHMGKGDMAVFPAGLSCIWDIQAPVKKHYRLD